MIDKAKEMLTKYAFYNTKFHKTGKAHNGHEIDMIATNVKIRNKSLEYDQKSMSDHYRDLYY